MAAKNTGLATFTGSQGQSKRARDAAPDELRTKAKGDIAHITLRLTRDQWERVHQLATAEGVSLNRLAIHALSRLFEDKGLPGL
jgi:hypothetical protein